jgi:SAM-dependent methyltransferase
MPNENLVPVRRRYSKSSAFYISTKKDFFSDNDALLRRALKQNALYASQPTRTHCKICRAQLPGSADFTSHGVGYTFCPDCSHLNGTHQDTGAFVEQLYIADAGKDYSSSYIDQNFAGRTSDIYVPKVDFLVDSLPHGAREILDVGCGSGYFVYAALLRNIAATGIDVGASMVEFGNRQISHLTGQSPLLHVEEDAFFRAVVESKADIISAIGVIEHLREPHEFFDAFARSGARYLYYSVPMFSLSVVLENIFKEVFPRQLSGGHTHLFTEESIRTMNALIGITPIAEWRFGTDLMDLYRGSVTLLQKNKVSAKLTEAFTEGFASSIDDLQSILDRNHFCSEIHCLGTK